MAAAAEHAVREAHQSVLAGATPRLDHGVARLRELQEAKAAR
jgi:hypothetical protein